MSKLSSGLNFNKKSGLNQRPPPAKRKTIFDDDDEEDNNGGQDNGLESIATFGAKGLQSRPPKPKSKPNDPSKPSLSTNKQTTTTKPSLTANLSTKHTAALHAQSAQTLDPSIYDYDGVYDSLHTKPAPSTTTTSNDGTTTTSKPKYMTSILAAAQVRKRDQLRAKERLLAREREAEGDAFADKETFVTGAYKRQQEELRQQEEDEARREKEDEERRKREGAGMKVLYRSILDRDEQRHKEMLQAVEEGKKLPKADAGADALDATTTATMTGETDENNKEKKTDTDLAREKGAAVNEDGEVVDKRQLLSAGLNAAAAPRPKPRPAPALSNTGQGRGPGAGDARANDTRAFEDSLLGKHGLSSSEDEEEDEDDGGGGRGRGGGKGGGGGGGGGRASKSRKMEDALLAAAGFDSDSD